MRPPLVLLLLSCHFNVDERVPTSAFNHASSRPIESSVQKITVQKRVEHVRKTVGLISSHFVLKCIEKRRKTRFLTDSATCRPLIDFQTLFNNLISQIGTSANIFNNFRILDPPTRGSPGPNQGLNYPLRTAFLVFKVVPSLLKIIQNTAHQLRCGPFTAFSIFHL